MMHKTKIIISSQNQNKVREMESILDEHNVEIKCLSEFTQKSPDENGKSFAENSLIKARWAYQFSKGKYSCLADDSGLCIKNLNDAPGVYSARWASNTGYEKVFMKIKNKFEDTGAKINNQPAEFVCVISFIDLKKREYLYTGKLIGELTFPPRGNLGFGYDPIFIPLGEKQTLAEMNKNKKNKVSHRKLALQKFIDDKLTIKNRENF